MKNTQNNNNTYSFNTDLTFGFKKKSQKENSLLFLFLSVRMEKRVKERKEENEKEQVGSHSEWGNGRGSKKQQDSWYWNMIGVAKDFVLHGMQVDDGITNEINYLKIWKSDFDG